MVDDAANATDERILSVIREKLSINLSIEHNSGSYGGEDYFIVKVALFIDQEEISSSFEYLTIPSGR